MSGERQSLAAFGYMVGMPMAWWDNLRASYWFRPSLYVALAIGIAAALLEIDHIVELPRRTSSIWWCISASLGRLARRATPSPYRYDANGDLRVIAYPVTFAHLLRRGCGPIRRYASSGEVVYRRLIRAKSEISEHARNETDRDALRAELRRIVDAARLNLRGDERFRGGARRRRAPSPNRIRIPTDGNNWRVRSFTNAAIPSS